VGFGIVDAEAALAKAARLDRAKTASAGIAATARFRGASVAEPVSPRGSGELVLFAMLALFSLVLVGVAGTRLAALRRGQQ
jgi:hypothetical protein